MAYHRVVGMFVTFLIPYTVSGISRVVDMFSVFKPISEWSLADCMAYHTAHIRHGTCADCALRGVCGSEFGNMVFGPRAGERVPLPGQVQFSNLV